MPQEISISSWDVYRRYWDAHAGNVGARQAVTHLSPVDYWNHYKGIFDSLVKFTPKKVIDLGCGPALLLENLPGYWPGIEYVGMDISHEMIAAAKERYPDGRFILMDAPAIGELCDLLLCHSVFTHISEQDAHRYLEWIRAVIQPMGMAIISIHTDCEKGIKGDIGRVDYEPTYFEEMVEQHGLEIVGYVDTDIQRYYGLK